MVRGPRRTPGVVAVVVALGIATAGGGLVVASWQQRLVRAARVDGLAVRLDNAVWVEDQMDHGQQFPKPPSMMPGLPAEGQHRLAVAIGCQNLGRATERYVAAEFVLVAEDGQVLVPATSQLAALALGPGQTLDTDLEFDADTTKDHGAFRLEWTRDGRTVRMPVPRPPRHEERQVRWPMLAAALPAGDGGRGGALFAANACSSCHGDPLVRDSNTIGPPLVTIGRDGATRVTGKGAPQYIYESILNPNELIAPVCRDGRPCDTPSAMPEYASLLTEQDMADLVAYLSDRGGR